jgi:hypothetical protein
MGRFTKRNTLQFHTVRDPACFQLETMVLLNPLLNFLVRRLLSRHDVLDVRALNELYGAFSEGLRFDTFRRIWLFSRIAGSDVRVRAKSWTGVAMRLPHPGLVQMWLFAVSR